MERERICSHSFPSLETSYFLTLPPSFQPNWAVSSFQRVRALKELRSRPGSFKVFGWSFPSERLFEKHLRSIGIVYLKNIEGICFSHQRYMFFALGVYLKNIEKYKGIYAISKIYLGLLRLPTLSLTLPLTARQPETLKTKKRSPGQVRSKK